MKENAQQSDDQAQDRVQDQTQDIEQDQAPEDQQDYLTVAQHGKAVKQSTIILAVLFVAGAVCLWFMISKTSPSDASAAVSDEEMQIEAAIAQITGIRNEMDEKLNDVSGLFDNFSDVDQIGVSELKKNPFMYDIGLSPDVTDEDQSLIEFTTESDLQLWSISTAPGQKSCCMIDDAILYVGDKINGYQVERIENKFVELLGNGRRVMLKMDE